MKARSIVLLAAVGLASPGFAADSKAAIAAGDAAYASRTAASGAAQALAHYESAFGSADEPEALWKAGRALHWLGDHTDNRRKKHAFFEMGIDCAKRAAAALPDRPEPHFWLAALYGSYGESRGVMKSLALLGPIRRELNEINRIDERFQGGAGHRVLGIVDYKVPGIAGGSRKRALERLNKALTVDPTNAFNHYYMAEGLVEAGRREEARRYLDILENVGTNTDVDQADLSMIQAKGEALRKKIDR